MRKITITQDIQEKYKNLVFGIFKNHKLEKKQDKKIIFSITIETIDKLLQKKLKHFDENITFEKLVLADFEYIKNLTEFIDTHSSIQLNKKEKSYFLTLYERLKKTEYVKMLSVTTCLYCNRNYIFNFRKNRQLEATAQVDHFFDKKTYPYLAVSLYNLVPCCSTCNQRKSTKKADIIHPFVESFDNVAKFRLDIKDSSFYHSLGGFDIQLHSNNPKAQNSIDVFNLNRLYQNHKDIILELIQKDVIYNDSYIDELYKSYEGTLFRNREDLEKLISGGFIQDDEINKRPLSKLIKDISQELGLT